MVAPAAGIVLAELAAACLTSADRGDLRNDAYTRVASAPMVWSLLRTYVNVSEARSGLRIKSARRPVGVKRYESG